MPPGSVISMVCWSSTWAAARSPRGAGPSLASACCAEVASLPVWPRVAVRGPVLAVPGRSPARQHVADADCGGDRPFDHTGRPDNAEAGQEAEAGQDAEARVGDVPEDGQVHPGRDLAVLLRRTVGLRPPGRRPTPGIRFGFIAHHVMLLARTVGAQRPVRGIRAAAGPQRGAGGGALPAR